MRVFQRLLNATPSIKVNRLRFTRLKQTGKQVLVFLIILPIRLPILFVFYLLSVRSLYVSFHYVGHLIAETDCLIKQVALKTLRRKRWVFFYDREKIANKAFLEILPNYIVPIHAPRYIRVIFNSKNSKKDTFNYIQKFPADLFKINNAWGDLPSALSVPIDWVNLTNELLSRVGFSANCKYICIHARESGHNPTKEGLHRYRNVEILSLYNSVAYLHGLGFNIIRMGDPSMSPLPKEFDKFNIFDYARSLERRPFLDLAISSGCHFFMSCSSGAAYLASVFGRPVLSTNMCLPFNYSPSGLFFDIGTPKLMLDKNTGKFISLRTIIERKLYKILTSNELDERCIELLPNSPTEIYETTREMVERLNGTWKDSASDRELQRNLRKLLPHDFYSYGTGSKCGSYFLRKYETLLT